MKTLVLALSCATLLPLATLAQQNKAYAITSETVKGFNWTAIREVNLSKGDVVNTVFSKDRDANKQQRMNVINAASAIGFNDYAAAKTTVSNRVAAAAYDKVHNRLYFSEMMDNRLKFIDLNNQQSEGSLSTTVNQDARFSTGSRIDESNIITRMTFAADGNGYALTNDGNQLIRFTTDAKPIITNLGAITDSRKNSTISIHSQCTSWGGDLVGDVYGNLYLFTARNYVFKINIQTMTAEYVGLLKGLPESFTTNGAAADDDGQIIIASATNASNSYKVNLATMQSEAIGSMGQYNVSDLASGNLAYQKNTVPTVFTTNTELSNTGISIFPNPAVGKTFTVQFGKIPAGTYTIEVEGINGKKVFVQSVTVANNFNQKINLPANMNTGMYLVRVSNNNGKNVFANKIVVE